MQEIVDNVSERLLQEMVRKEHFSGAAMVSKADRRVHRRAYGPSSGNLPNRVDGRFHVGSLCKQFTAAAVLQLTEVGLADLGACINEFLPRKYRSGLWSGILVEHLLSHTSGIPDYAVVRDYYRVVDGWAFGETIDGMIKEAMKAPLGFTPGTRFQYSNIGYTLLGEIIQNQTGRPFANYVEEKLLAPLGMDNSKIHDENFAAANCDPCGLRWDDAAHVHIKDDVISLPVTPADGGLVTTLDDFACWVAAVYRDLSHPDLSPESIERMLQISAPTDSYRWPERCLRGEGYYGLGLMRSGDLIMHEGSIVGFRSFFIYSRRDDLLISIFSNNTHNDVCRIAEELFRLHG
ncbi:serine hydrolase domain-containing protein [Hoeflea poritis]|uniref:Serine hydrolase n=1 Tax=Hoeflea poritis TaxID=2993659 RepID=A0ABT4VVK1_9HYPH|nr:serine hydrolase domain-containing protein [Hoeflea poritis]MDA4848734.1 serine hydrolase [Hoeflea poritis]